MFANARPHYPIWIRTTLLADLILPFEVIVWCIEPTNIWKFIILNVFPTFNIRFVKRHRIWLSESTDIDQVLEVLYILAL